MARDSSAADSRYWPMPFLARASATLRKSYANGIVATTHHVLHSSPALRPQPADTLEAKDRLPASVSAPGLPDARRCAWLRIDLAMPVQNRLRATFHSPGRHIQGYCTVC
jgi:hypothetical protein